MRKLKIAVVGAGTWGENHARIYMEHKQAELVALCDTDSQKDLPMKAAFSELCANSHLQAAINCLMRILVAMLSIFHNKVLQFSYKAPIHPL